MSIRRTDYRIVGIVVVSRDNEVRLLETDNIVPLVGQKHAGDWFAALNGNGDEVVRFRNTDGV